MGREKEGSDGIGNSNSLKSLPPVQSEDMSIYPLYIRFYNLNICIINRLKPLGCASQTLTIEY